MFQAVPPEEHSVAERDLLQPVNHQLQDLFKKSKQHGYSTGHLLLGLLEVTRVDVPRFECSKQELDRHCIIAVPAREHDRDRILLVELQHLGAPVVGGPVNKDDMGLAPAWPVSVQHHDEVLEK